MSIARANCRFELNKRCQLFIRTHNEPLSVATMCISTPSDIYSWAGAGRTFDGTNQSASGLRIVNLLINEKTAARLALVSRRILYFDGLEFADVKLREQPLPPTVVVGFRSEAGHSERSFAGKAKDLGIADVIYEAIESFVAKCEAEAELETKIIKFPTSLERWQSTDH
ncbi:MAG TPA: hypothetical protein VLQ29_08395 [Candidatus Dormibacteraeota bacterium]|nr:hypothetical protein [Candidatus Dormibacteraeota bacterium]